MVMFSNYRANYLSDEIADLRKIIRFSRGARRFSRKCEAPRENSRRERNLANLSGRFERVVRAEEAGTAAA